MKKRKIYNWLLFLMLFLTILSIILIRPLSDLDEIWNYNFALNISNGMIPYKDFNMVPMPLLSIICGIVLKIISNQLIVMRVLATFLCTSIIYTAYKLFILLEIKKQLAFIFSFVITALFQNLFCIDYNFATLLLVLYIIFIEINNYKKNEKFLNSDYKSDLLLGVLTGLTIALKQSTGLFISLALLSNKLLFIKNNIF